MPGNTASEQAAGEALLSGDGHLLFLLIQTGRNCHVTLIVASADSYECHVLWLGSNGRGPGLRTAGVDCMEGGSLGSLFFTKTLIPP
jgi:hypothetical protein